LLKDTNNQLHAYCLKLVSHKQALQNRDKELAIVKTQLFKLQTKNKHFVAKSVKAERVIKEAKVLQSGYNELTHAYFKTRDDLKTL
jgi:hypothetical protein